MKPAHLLVSAAVAASLVSCASQGDNQYDTPGDPYGVADASMANPPAYSNPVYDSPAAYEDAAAADHLAPAVPHTQLAPAIPDPTPAYPSATPSARPAASASAIIHTVVKGDTLSGISAKYNVPMASIKAANQMTNDTVVLGRKMVIPPR